MEAKSPSPQTTLLILLGASAWPYSPEFHGSDAFARAADGVRDYFLHPQLFGLPRENFLDLFDSEKVADEIDAEVGAFVEQRLSAMKAAGNAGRDILLYFIGHGGFAGSNYEYYLAIRRTRTGNPLASGLQVASLAYTLKEQARHVRLMLILDCCFAQRAFALFQGGPDQVALRQTIDAFQMGGKSRGIPAKGMALLSSSNQRTPSLLLADFSSTMFTKAFLDALTHGAAMQRERLSLRDVKEATWEILSVMPDAPRPVVDSPDQSEGDVADVPFFPNPWFEREQARVVEEERTRKVEEDRRQQSERAMLSPPIDRPENASTPAAFFVETTPTPAPAISISSSAMEAASLSSAEEMPAISSSAVAVVPAKRSMVRGDKWVIGGCIIAVLVLLFGGIGEVIYRSNTVNRAVANNGINSSITQTNAKNRTQISKSLATSNPDPYSPGNGKLTLYDSMHDNSNQGFGWDEGNGCTFTGSTYQIASTAPGCGAKNVELNDFAFEIEVGFTQKSIEAASIFFRFASSPETFYALRIYNDGTYDFEASATSLSGTQVIPIYKTGISSDTIRKGIQNNVIAIVAVGSTITLYINRMKVDSFQDDSSNYGTISLSSEDGTVDFSNAKVWTF